MINRGVKGITLDPANAMALVPIVKKAHDAGRSDHQHLAATAGGGGGGLRDRQFPGRDSDRPVGEGDDGIEACAYRAARLRSFGFGVSEGDPQIAGSALNMGNAETGQTAMENFLSAHPDINVLYTIDEPAAQGAHFAIKKAKRDVLVTSIDGSYSGLHSVADGTIGATVMQSPTAWARCRSRRSSRRSGTE
jgi:fructose transport system substrate-binding protein